MKFRLLFFTAIFALKIFSQNDTLKKLNLSMYGELYYSYDFDKPQNHDKPNFLYNHKRHNELNLNLLLLKANYLDKNYRANIGVMSGNYAQYNLSSESIWAQFIYEANLGIKISNKHNLWLDVGVLPSHIGFESAISADCWTLTRSLLAENSPYFETGLKMGYTSKNEKLYIAALYLNGWQRIEKPDYFQNPAFGTQVTYKPTQNITFNYSTFVGSAKPDSVNSIRQFHNVYLQYEPTKKFGLIAGFDIGRDKFNSSTYGTWYSPVLIMKYHLNEKSRLAFRTEFYNDANQIIISTNTSNGFQTYGFSSNLDHDFNDKIKFRVEGKLYQSKDLIFKNGNNNYSITTNMTVRF